MSNEPGPRSRRSPVEDRPYRRYRADGQERAGRGTDRPYKIYRSAPRGLLSRLRGEDDLALEEERRGRDGGGRRPGPGSANPWWRRQLRPRRVLSCLAIAIVGWLLLSFALFMISASNQAGNIPAAALAELTPGQNMLTSTDTILILGTDQRPRTGPGSKEPGSNYNDAGSNSDTIMLWRVGGGVSRRLSIPRDTAYDIPGVGLAKINAAYSAGGPALALKTIKQFTGLQINHMIIVNLANFPKFIDAIGGITLTTDRVCSNISGGTAKGGFTLDLAPGVHHLDGEQALILARTRENSCNPAENDLTRERRQQEILNAIKSRLLSPSTFFRLPWASWDAPQTLRTDMGGFTLLSLFAAAEIGGSAPTALLPTTPETLPDGGDALNVSPAAVRTAVTKLMDG
ncbi:MAG: LCP family protein [Solirubrobacteraceae bacterium]